MNAAPGFVAKVSPPALAVVILALPVEAACIQPALVIEATAAIVVTVDAHMVVVMEFEGVMEAVVVFAASDG